MNFDKIAIWIASKLEKLRVSNPIIYLLIVGLIGVIAGLFSNGTISVPTPNFLIPILNIFSIDSLNGFIIGVLWALTAILNPAISQWLKKK